MKKAKNKKNNRSAKNLGGLKSNKLVILISVIPLTIIIFNYSFAVVRTTPANSPGCVSNLDIRVLDEPGQNNSKDSLVFKPYLDGYLAELETSVTECYVKQSNSVGEYLLLKYMNPYGMDWNDDTVIPDSPLKTQSP